MKEFIDKLIERLREESYFARPRGMETETVVEIGTAISIVNELAEKYKSDWIPCSERLPNEATTYQVTEEVVINSKKQYVVDIRLFGTEGEWLCPSNRKIIAWMPLPAPYTEGE